MLQLPAGARLWNLYQVANRSGIEAKYRKIEEKIPHTVDEVRAKTEAPFEVALKS